MSGKRLSVPSGSERFVARRKSRRRRALLALSVLLFVALSALIWGLRQSAVRIAHVEIYGADKSLSEIVFEHMRGNYLGIIPRDSTFFLPSAGIRSDILTVYPDIAAISLFRDGFSGLSIKADYRVPIARWCGSTPSTSSGQTSSPQVASTTAGCYLFDASGFIYATTSTTLPLNSFVLYEPAAREGDPIGLTLPHPEKLPAAFDFARKLTTFGSAVSSIVIHDGEVDEYLESGTRVTYVLGNEQGAFTALTSARKNLNLADGSLDYVDLRFSGKLYLKKK